MNYSVAKDLGSTNLETSMKRNICRPFRALHVWQATKRWDLFSSPHRRHWKLWLCAMAAAGALHPTSTTHLRHWSTRHIGGRFYGTALSFDRWMEAAKCLQNKDTSNCLRHLLDDICILHLIVYTIIFYLLHMSKQHDLSVNTTHTNR